MVIESTRSPVRASQLGLFLLAMVAAMVFFHGGAVWGSMVFSGGDLVNYFIPLRDSQLREGWFAGWLPETFSGRPAGDDPQTGLFYPPNWLHITGIAPERVITWLSLLHFIFGATGLYLFLRVKFDHFPALFSGLVWSFCGYQILRLDNGVIPFVYAQAWVPWMLLAAERQRLDTVVGRRWLALLGFFGALQLSIGAAQISQITWVGLAIWTLGRFWRENAKGIAALFGGFVVAGILALLANAPMLSGYLRLSAEALPRGADDLWSFLSDGSLRPRVLLTWLIPEIFSPGNVEGMYWGSQVGYPETNAYMGVIPLLLALFAMVWLVVRVIAGRGTVIDEGDREWLRWGLASGVAALLGILVALGSYGFLFRPLVDWVPTFDYFRVPARWSLWFVVAVSILSAMGMQLLMKSPGNADGDRPLRTSWFVAAGLILLLYGGLRVAVYPLLDGMGMSAIGRAIGQNYPEVVDRFEEFPGRAAQWALVMALGGVVFGTLLVLRRMSPVVLAVFLVVLSMGDLLRFWSPYRPPVPLDIHRFEILSESEYHRIDASAFRDFFYPESDLVRGILALPGDGRFHILDTLMAYTHDQLNRELLFERPASNGNLDRKSVV